MHELQGHQVGVVAILGAGANVLSISRDGIALLWELGSGSCLRTTSLLHSQPATMSSMPKVAAELPFAADSLTAASLPSPDAVSAPPTADSNHAMTLATAAATAAAAATTAAVATASEVVGVSAQRGGLVCLTSVGVVKMWTWPAALPTVSVGSYRQRGWAVAPTAGSSAAGLAEASGAVNEGTGEGGASMGPSGQQQTTTTGMAALGSLSGFSAARVQQRIERLVPSVAADAPEFMAAVLEVVATQMLQRAGDAAAAGSCGRIEPHHIRRAVEEDQDLARLVGEEALSRGGMLRPDDAEMSSVGGDEISHGGLEEALERSQAGEEEQEEGSVTQVSSLADEVAPLAAGDDVKVSSSASHVSRGKHAATAAAVASSPMVESADAADANTAEAEALIDAEPTKAADAEMVGKALGTAWRQETAVAQGAASSEVMAGTPTTTGMAALGSLSGFSAARVQQRIERLVPSVAADAPEFMAAVLEVVATQMLQRAGDAAAAGSCGRIEPHHIRRAVEEDQDLARLVGEEALSRGGMLRPDDAEI